MALKILLRSPPQKSEGAPPGVLRSVMAARFDYVFDMLIHSIINTKFGLLHRSKAYGSDLCVPVAL